MSLFHWFSPKKAAQIQAPESSGLSREQATLPATPAKRKAQAATPGGASQSGHRKTERLMRRELLYQVVRESMVRVGLLSSSYKFKVLSLDQRGRRFMVMMDLAREFSGESDRQAEIEALIAQSAKARYNIEVTAVYWRTNEHVATGHPDAHVPLHAPASGLPPVSQPVPLMAATPVPIRAVPRYEPLEADEVASFQRALMIASKQPSSPAAGASHSSRNYTLLTGYEDTEMPETDAEPGALSGTQYGELR